MAENPLVGFLCECGNIVIANAERALDGRWFRSAYCPDCVRRVPLKKLIVKEIFPHARPKNREVGMEKE